MRMWMVDPYILCRKHLLGEHVELHMFLGAIKKGTSMRGYIDNDLLEPMSIEARHIELVEEMTKRGMNHKSSLIARINVFDNLLYDDIIHKIDKHMSLYYLTDRCEECRLRAAQLSAQQMGPRLINPYID